MTFKITKVGMSLSRVEKAIEHLSMSWDKRTSVCSVTLDYCLNNVTEDGLLEMLSIVFKGDNLLSMRVFQVAKTLKGEPTHD